MEKQQRELEGFGSDESVLIMSRIYGKQSADPARLKSCQ